MMLRILKNIGKVFSEQARGRSACVRIPLRGSYCFSEKKGGKNSLEITFEEIKMQALIDALNKMEYTQLSSIGNVLLSNVSDLLQSRFARHIFDQQRQLNLSHSFPELAFDVQLKTVLNFAKKLIHFFAKREIEKQKAVQLMKCFEDEIDHCLENLGQVKFQMKRELAQFMLIKNRTYVRFIFCLTFETGREKEDSFKRAEKYTKKLFAAKCSIYEQNVEEKTDNLEMLRSDLIENLVQCSFFQGETIKALYNENGQREQFLVAGEQGSRIWKVLWKCLTRAVQM